MTDNTIAQDTAIEETAVVDVVDPAREELLLAMAKAGVLYGHKKPRKDPKFGEFVFGVRNGLEIIDLEKTIERIDAMAVTLKEFMAQGKSVMVVGTQPAAREAVYRLAAVLKGPYVVNKWIGGLITNFPILSGRIEYFRNQKKLEEDNQFAGYTKKERLMIRREIESMQERFEGLENYTAIPDAMFLIDSSASGHFAALREATIKGCTVLGIIDNDDNPGIFDQCIPANDHTKSSIEWVVDALIERIK